MELSEKCIKAKVRHPDRELSEKCTKARVHHPDWELSGKCTKARVYHPDWELSGKCTKARVHHPDIRSLVARVQMLPLFKQERKSTKLPATVYRDISLQHSPPLSLIDEHYLG